MANFTKYSLHISFICVLLYASMEQVLGLKCYICHTDNNESCMNELYDCPADQAYDRCMTTIYKSPIDGKHIKKECALAPCHLRGVGKINFANFKSDCETSAQDCTFCCPEDGCNKDAAPSTLHSTSVQLICLMLVLVHLHHLFYRH
ncbi:hypothetical protein BLOT_014758 [Blomia tropicalis]|nr:hypothetical protein BLOT_014758 [Blomia tropicalis]